MSRTSASKDSATKWIIELDRHEVESAIDWSRDLFARYDTTEMASIRIGKGRGRASGVYGQCTYPRVDFPYYSIRCYVPGPFPCLISTRQSPIYRQLDGGWPPIPEGCVEGIYCRAEKGGVVREWKRVIGYTEALTQEEGIIWIVAHEAFHFLRRTQQLPGRNTEIEADKFADEQLKSLRKLRQRWRK
jgi:hypothetical protein